MVCEEVNKELSILFNQIANKHTPRSRSRSPLLKPDELFTNAELEDVAPAICRRVTYRTANWQVYFWIRCHGVSLDAEQYELLCELERKAFEKLFNEVEHVKGLLLNHTIAFERSDLQRECSNKDDFVKQLLIASISDLQHSYRSKVLRKTLKLSEIKRPDDDAENEEDEGKED
ncbi:unnamed protein product [Agarophyton chilense]